ncbi:MAG: glycoside hydrolase family 2 [Clostridia bacterium]|nr:glycoside hydrolase family 2 [Clostridia bacterium]
MQLNGTWKLYYHPASAVINTPADLAVSGIVPIPATVPGNVELDLSAAGILPDDLFYGMNITEAERFEICDWWYETEFTPAAPAPGEVVTLHFGGVDCFADYFLDGVKLGESDNMLIAHDFDVTDRLRWGQPNRLHVHIYSPIVRAAEAENELSMSLYDWSKPVTASWTRKAAHSYGWDIMPRAVSAGLWRPVELRYAPRYGFRSLYFNLKQLNGSTGRVQFAWDSTVAPEHIFADLDFIITGVCGEHRFTHKFVSRCKAGAATFDIPNLRLWWPRPYGEANLYDITVEVYHKGEKILAQTVRRGFRTLKLRRDDVLVEGKGRFEFVVNGVRIMAVGSNWVPLDAYHSRDAERLLPALNLAVEAGCNILRCWGGNVYEDHAFFDFCDAHGIMVWQDFAMACASYPRSPAFVAALTREAEWLVRELRDHPSLVLWCGDNEVDVMTQSRGGDPSQNILTREVLPRVLERLDPERPYIPSSPYISPAAFAAGPAALPEDHLWGPRDYHKSPYYTQSRAAFVSETGYHGCPSRRSIERFITPERVWPYQNNPEWNLHSTDQMNSPSRVMLMHRQVAQLFGEVPTDMDDYTLASQISQAEAKKFFIERVRAKMGRMGGVIWWNLIDGWPQMSDAVVDYYYEKKLAFDYIRRSSAPFMVMLDEMAAWGHPIICANSTRETVRGSLTITDLDSGETVWTGDFTAAPNANTTLGKLSLMHSAQGMFLLRWTTDRGEGFNTYLYGTPAFSLEKYKGWLEKIAEIEWGKPLTCTYYAVLDYADDGINITFPDVAGAYTCAHSTEEALVMAEDVLNLWLDGMRPDELPPAIADENLTTKTNETVVKISTDLYIRDGVLFSPRVIRYQDK